MSHFNTLPSLVSNLVDTKLLLTIGQRLSHLRTYRNSHFNCICICVCVCVYPNSSKYLSSFLSGFILVGTTASNYWSRKNSWHSVLKWPCIWPTSSLVMSSRLYLIAVGSWRLTGGTSCFSSQSSSVIQNSLQILIMWMKYGEKDIFLPGLSG